MTDHYQTCTLVLSDGRRLTYTGPAQIEDDGSAKVVEIRLSVPQRLPMDLAWQQMEEGKQ